MKTSKKITFAAIIASALPLLASAQIGSAPPSNFSPNLSSLGQTIINQLWIVFTIIAVVMFVLAGIQFLTSQGDPDKVKTARMSFMWGVAGIIVGVVAYTIVSLVRGALGA